MAKNRIESDKNTRTSQPLLVTVEGRLFDVTEFAPRHPGGEEVLKLAAGSEVSQFLKGQDELIGFKHVHSRAAYDILQRFSLDKQFKNDPLIDNREPILGRVGELGERYWTWIHQPYDGAVRLFKSDFLEQLTRTKWWVIPLVWLPFIMTMFLSGLWQLFQDFGLKVGLLFGILLFIFGIFCWTLLEYTLHRCVFHWHPDPKSARQVTLHFLLHGLHHKTPLDRERLVFPPAAALIFVAVFYSFYRLLLPYPIFCCFGTGKLFGYVLYDMNHYYLHHGSPKANSAWHHRKVYHHNHHFKDSESGFGISTTLWDHVFGTLSSPLQ